MSFKTLVTITNNLSGNYPQNTVWQNSQFNWIRGLPPGSKGTVGRNIATGLLTYYGFTAMTNKTEIRVNGNRVAVRLAMLWQRNILKFQNIRDGRYDYVLCLGLCPTTAYGWLIPIGEVWRGGAVRTNRAGVTRQHKGADAWISIPLANAHDWTKPLGGSIDDLIKVCKKNLA